jgi:hypothetical protein
MSSAFPPGGTYFDGRKSFADVNYDTAKDNAINTTQFLEASESLTTLFDVIGGAAFKPVKSDMQGNIKVRPDLNAARLRTYKFWIGQQY